MLGFMSTQLCQRGEVCVQCCDAPAVLHFVVTNARRVMPIECQQNQLADVETHQQQAKGCAGRDNDQVLCLHVLCSSVEPAAGIIGERTAAGVRP
ncbi:hypothetical protein D3C86_1737680 [compost metagenome]